MDSNETKELLIKLNTSSKYFYHKSFSYPIIIGVCFFFLSIPYLYIQQNISTIDEEVDIALNSTRPSDDIVDYLPGFGTPLEKQYASLVQVNEYGGNLFYWFFECRSSSSSPLSSALPIFIWLNGGPGASSMTGLLSEMGPYRIQSNGSLFVHPQSWSTIGHMLFIDQPVGTGYTSALNDKGYVSSQEEMAQQLYSALIQFFEKHSEYKLNPIYICGESYAGKYIPYISFYIHKMNLKKRSKSLNLVGIAIGNGSMWPVLQTRAVPDYALALGFINAQQYDYAVEKVNQCAHFHEKKEHVNAFAVCQAIEDEIYQKFGGNPFVYDVRKYGNPFDTLTTTLTHYFNNVNVRKALHVGESTIWKSIDGSSYGTSPSAPPVARHLLQDEMLDVPKSIFKVLLDNYKFMFYAGNMDGSSCNGLGIARVIDQLDWKFEKEFKKSPRVSWKVKGQPAGLVQSYKNTSFVTITNCGHLVPTDQPDAALDMMSRFVQNIDFSQVR